MRCEECNSVMSVVCNIYPYPYDPKMEILHYICAVCNYKKEIINDLSQLWK